MDRDGLIRYTKTILDEISPIDGLMDDISIADFGSDKPVDDFIDTLLDESATETLLLAPTYYCPVSVLPSGSLVVSGGVGVAAKPADFLKCARFRLASWERAVNATVSEGSPRADLQGNPYLRGGTAKPVVVEERGRLLFYPCDSGDAGNALSVLEYVGERAAEDVGEELQKPLCWLCASKALGIAGNLNGQKLAKERFAELVQEVRRKEV